MAADPSKLSYFSLPSEIRNKIMDLVLVHGDVYPYRPASKASTPSQDFTVIFKPRAGIQLIATCKQAYREGHEIYYSSNTFHLTPAMTFEWSDNLQAKHKDMIKRISIKLGLDELDAGVISRIERHVADLRVGFLGNDDDLLGKAVIRALSSGWRSKLWKVAAWTSLEQIEIRSVGNTRLLQHHDVTAMEIEIERWDKSEYWCSVLKWPLIHVLLNTKAVVVRVGWRKATEWLRTRKSGELAEEFWLTGGNVPAFFLREVVESCGVGNVYTNQLLH